MNRDLLLLIAAMRAYDAVHELHQCDACGATWEDDTETCRWCVAYRAAQAEAVLRPPALRGYGYALPEDLVGLGIDPVAEREADLREWARDLEMAVGGQVITQAQADAAWATIERERQRAA